MVKINRDATVGVCPQGEVPVDSEIASEQTYSVIDRGLVSDHLGELVARQVVVRLSRMASLTAITLLSVGLWAAIWVVASSLAAVWLRSGCGKLN
jgi:hypothetical protein